MDLEALPPDEPTPPADTEQPHAPRASWEPAPWQAASSDPGSTGAPGWARPAAEAGPPVAATRPGFSRSTKIMSGALAMAVIAGGAWAAGTALHSTNSTVRFQPAAATTGATTGGTGTAPATPGTGGPRHRGGPGLGLGRGGAGTVATLDLPGSFTVTVPTRPTAPPTGAAPAAPAAPTTKSVTIKISSATTYTTTKQGSLADVVTGMRIVGVGTADSTGTVAATQLNLVAAGVGPTPPTPPKAPATAPVVPAAPVNHPSLIVGTVTTVTKDSPATGDVTVVVSTPRGVRTLTATPTTTVVVTAKGAPTDVTVGALVLARGTHNADGSITATAVQIVAAGLKGGRGGFGFGFGGRGFGPGPGFGPGGMGHRWGGPGAPGTDAPAGVGTGTSPI